MAAFVFPLIVKMLLVREGCYALTDEDKVRCTSVDKLLTAKSWRPDDDDEAGWQKIISDERSKQGWERAMKKVKEMYPDAFDEGPPTQ